MDGVSVSMVALARTDPRVELLRDYLARLAALNYSPMTVRGYRLAVTKFLETYPGVPLERMTPEHIERHLFDRAVAPRTKAYEYQVLRAFFKYLVKQRRLLRRNPCDGAEKPRWTARVRPAVSLEQFEAMRRLCRTLKEAVALELYFFTGLRLREALGLRVRDVDLAHRRITVVFGKGSKARVVVFPERLAMLLRAHLGGFEGRAPLPPDAYVLGSSSAGPREWLRRLFIRLGTEAGVPYRVTPHLLRHGFVRLCKVRGVPLDVAAKLLGHNSIITTSKLYGQLDVGDLQQVYDRLIGEEQAP
jgi:integrase